MNFNDWAQNTLKEAVAYLKREKTAEIIMHRVRPKKKTKARKKPYSSKKLKKAA